MRVDVGVNDESHGGFSGCGDRGSDSGEDKRTGFRIVLSIAGCVMLMYFVVSRFRLIASYIDRLTAYVSVNISYIDVILKMIGIAYICRFSSDICKDAGCNAMASQVEMAGKITLILLSMPILMGVIDLVVTIVEG